MPDLPPQPATASHPLRSGRPDGPAGVHVRPRRGLRIVELAALPVGAERLAATLRELGIDSPPEPGRSRQHDGSLLLWRAPDTWYLVTEDATLVRRVLAAAGSLAVELTGAFTVLRLSGRNVLDLLAKAVTVDLEAPRHAPGAAFTTGTPVAPVTIHRLAGDQFDLYVPRSYAASFVDWLAVLAAEFGFETAP